MTTRSTSPFVLLLTVAVLVFGTVASAAAQSESPAPEAAERAAPEQLESPAPATTAPARKRIRGGLAVYHGAVEVALADVSSDGHQLGDVRVTSAPTTDFDGDPLGRLDATLTTTAIDVPEVGDEVRISTLVFSFGKNGVHQVVIGGSAVYPAEGATIATGESTTRPILGGSGRLEGASGSAVTSHLDDGSWVHVLKLDRRGERLERLLEKEIKARSRERLRELRAKQKAKRVDRREARAAKRASEEAAAAGVPANAAAPAVETGITRTDLGLAEPGSSPGEELGLWRYSIPAGSELAPHTHPGWQIAHIESGELAYEVISGEGTIIRSDGGRETIGPGSYTLGAGDAVVENPDLAHFGANRTDSEVVILAATLYPQGAPLSTPLETVAAG